jgi:hypothetical protein
MILRRISAIRPQAQHDSISFFARAIAAFYLKQNRDPTFFKMVPIPILLLLYPIHILAAVVSIPPAGPPSIQGVQGNDDQVMSLHLLQNGQLSDLKLRYTTIQQQLAPGNRRYNMFWSEFEMDSPSAAPMPCRTGTVLIPANEVRHNANTSQQNPCHCYFNFVLQTDRVARGYNRYHCYRQDSLSANDVLLAMDASIGSVSTAIVYGSPDYAIHPNCTGFPWPPNPNFRLGCIPWQNFDDWEDFINLILERWSAALGSNAARLSGLCIWNEIQSMGWSDPSPVLPNRYHGQPWSADQMNVFAGAIAELFKRAGNAAKRHSQGLMLWLSTDHFTTPPPLQLGDVHHIGLNDFLDSFWPHVVNQSYSWGVCVHPYDAGDPRQDLLQQGIYTFATLRKGVAR